jgi:hypothetical protein
MSNKRTRGLKTNTLLTGGAPIVDLGLHVSPLWLGQAQTPLTLSEIQPFPAGLIILIVVVAVSGSIFAK